MAWAADNRTLFYTVEDDGQAASTALYRHALGAAARTTLVYEEKDERFNVGVGRTRSRAYLHPGRRAASPPPRCAYLPRRPARRASGG